MGTNIGKCRDCNEPIVWMTSFRGSNIPVDLESASNELDIDTNNKVAFDKRKGHVCHWDTCQSNRAIRVRRDKAANKMEIENQNDRAKSKHRTNSYL